MLLFHVLYFPGLPIKINEISSILRKYIFSKSSPAKTCRRIWMIFGARESWWSLLSRAPEIIQFDWFIAELSRQTWAREKSTDFIYEKYHLKKTKLYACVNTSVEKTATLEQNPENHGNWRCWRVPRTPKPQNYAGNEVLTLFFFPGKNAFFTKNNVSLYFLDFSTHQGNGFRDFGDLGTRNEPKSWIFQYLGRRNR